MAIKKSELYSSLWKSCDELRGGMDASQYKDYVLTLLFIKYVSDKYAGKEDALVYVPEGGSFEDMVGLKGKPNIGEEINKIIGKLAEENDLKGVIDLTDFNEEDKLGKGKEMVDRLSRLIGIFQNPALNFSRNRADGDDILGDAYEYLMRHFATESGKSKGQFYTPSEVSRILAKVIGVEAAQSRSETVYDPTCGSGSLLLKVAYEAPEKVTLYGQEMDNSTRALAVMNMWLHGNPEAEIWRGNTLSSPHWTEGHNELKRFDYVVANPPFSAKAWSSGLIDEDSKSIKDPYGRFEGFGIPPAKNGDYAFLLHIVKSLKSTGAGAVILPHGVLFRGNAEATIREQLVRRGLIKGIIGLPPNLFYGTGIPACIIILDKKEAEERDGIFMIDASKGFLKDGNKNRLREQDIHKIVDVYNKALTVSKYSRFVPFEEIEQNEFNLNIPRYIDNQEEEDVQDLSAHLLGGIPAADVDLLSNFWEVYPSMKDLLFASNGREGYYELNVPKDQIRDAIFGHQEFLVYKEKLDKVFQQWREENRSILKGISPETKAKKFIYSISEKLLEDYSGRLLIDKYDIYQHLLDSWTEIMKDDVYMLIEEGWKVTLEPVKDSKGRIKKGEFTSDLVPKELMINRYFQEEQEAIQELEQEIEMLGQAMEELLEEHGGDEGLLNEVLNDKGKVTKSSLTKRLKEIKSDGIFGGEGDEDAEEREVLELYLKEYEKEAKAKKKLKSAQTELDKKILAKYPELTEEEVKVLVVEDKWLTAIQGSIQAEIDGISQRLTNRINELADRYENTLSELESRVKGYEEKVNMHLEKMGLTWK
jgi:type I restriction enzyme M protein